MKNVDKVEPKSQNRESVNSEFEDDISTSDKATSSGYTGITSAYAVSCLELPTYTLCEYTMTPFVSVQKDDCPRHTRAAREMLRQRGKKPPKIAYSALRDELLILPGAAMSVADIVVALERFIKITKSHGMYVGKYKDEWIKEKVKGDPKFVAD